MRNKILNTIPARARRGFTLVELLVATALTLLIMSILASTFQTAIDSLSYLRAAGELQDRLRTASERVKLDLLAPHFEDESIPYGKVSNVRFDQNPGIVPQAGFFRIVQTNPSTEENGTTAFKPNDYSSMSTSHGLVFTSKLPGTSRQSVFTAPRVPSPNSLSYPELDHQNDNLIQDPAQFYASRWGIVSWFLVPMGESTAGALPAQQQPLFKLCRHTLVLAEVPNTFIDTNYVEKQNYAYVQLATPANAGQLLTASDVTTARPANLFTPNTDGSDVVLSNVLSFEVKADYTVVPTNIGGVVSVYPRPSTTIASLISIFPTVSNINSNANNQDYPFDDLPKQSGSTSRVFDTGLYGGTGMSSVDLPAVVPQSFRVRALQIKIRVYDPKTRSTRQVTIVQDM